MSEIKGQLLGIVLVIAIFGVVAGALTLAFSNVTSGITQRIEDVASYDVSKTGTNTLIAITDVDDNSNYRIGSGVGGESKLVTDLENNNYYSYDNVI